MVSRLHQNWVKNPSTGVNGGAVSPVKVRVGCGKEFPSFGQFFTGPVVAQGFEEDVSAWPGQPGPHFTKENP